MLHLSTNGVENQMVTSNDSEIIRTFVEPEPAVLAKTP